MGLIISAAIMAAGAIMDVDANERAKSEERHKTRMTEINNDIKKSQLFGDTYIASEQMYKENERSQSQSNTIAAAQLRRSDSGSVQAINNERTRMLNKNIKRMEERAEAGGTSLDIATRATKRSSKARQRAGDTRVIGGIMNVGSSLSGTGWGAMEDSILGKKDD